PKGEKPRGFKTPGFLKRGPFWGFLKPPKFFPGENFPRGKILGPLFPPKRGKTPGFFKNPRGFKKGAPFWGF
ncbi:hypothetical protein ED853_19165, partial [Acinetobacter baumannii]